MDDIRETSRQLEITTGQLATARVTLKEIEAALQDPARVHINMLRGAIAWTPKHLRHLLGDSLHNAEQSRDDGKGLPT
jgi:hypothetical protein